MKRMFLLRLAFAVLPALLAAPGIAAADEAGATEEVREIIPRYVLADVRGRPVSSEDFRGRYQFITFGYTFCPDICPTTLATMTAVLGHLGDKAAQVQPIFVTVDPERDTAEVLARYTEYFDRRIIGLRGSPELVRRAADNFKISYRKYSEPGAAPDSYTVDHSAGIYLLAPDGSFLIRFMHSAAPKEIAARLDAIIGSAPFSGRPSRR